MVLCSVQEVLVVVVLVCLFIIGELYLLLIIIHRLSYKICRVYSNVVLLLLLKKTGDRILQRGQWISAVTLSQSMSIVKCNDQNIDLLAPLSSYCCG